MVTIMLYKKESNDIFAIETTAVSTAIHSIFQTVPNSGYRDDIMVRSYRYSAITYYFEIGNQTNCNNLF